MTDSFPALEQLGITRPREIVRYSLQSLSDVDILRIIYKRQKGSMLPVSRKYKFGRAEKTVIVDSGQNKTAVVREISPFLLKVTEELDALVSAHQNNEERIAIIREELERLQEDVAARISYIQTLLEQCD